MHRIPRLALLAERTIDLGWGFRHSTPEPVSHPDLLGVARTRLSVSDAIRTVHRVGMLLLNRASL